MFDEKISNLIKLFEDGIVTEKEMFDVVKDISRNIPVSDDPLFNEDLYFELIYRDGILGYSVYQGYCGAESEIYIPEYYRGLPVICVPEEAFLECKNLIEVFLPDTLIYIERFAFSQCHNLERIILPNSVKCIGCGAFEGCVRLETIVLSNNLEYIDEDVINGCDSLKSITIPSSLKKVPTLLCAGCENLVTAFVKNGVKEVGYGSFERCYSLWKVELPTSLEKIEKNAFSQCESLRKIIFEGNYEEWLQIEKDNDWNRDTPSFELKCLDRTITIAEGANYMYTEEWLNDRLRCNPHELIRKEIFKKYIENN